MIYELNVAATSDEEVHVSKEFLCNAIRWKMKNIFSYFVENIKFADYIV